MSAAKPSPAAAGWAATRERSNLLTLRLMAWIAVSLGRPLARTLLHPIALYYLSFAAAPRRHSARYLARALGRAPSWAERYRHIHSFAATVLDRVYFVRGQLQHFDLQVSGGERVDATLAEGGGAFLLGAHLGSFEALHAVGASRPGLRIAMAMYPDNARKIQQVLQALAPGSELAVIAIGRSGSTLQIRDALDGGSLVGLLGDRFLAADQSARGGPIELTFLGRPARFTDGPLRLALLLRKRVIFMVGLYRGGRRYEVRFETLADFSQPIPREEREARIRAALTDYVAKLESLCREAPFNWFNFHDYWNEDAPH